jgi:hypothetical protein
MTNGITEGLLFVLWHLALSKLPVRVRFEQDDHVQNRACAVQWQHVSHLIRHAMMLRAQGTDYVQPMITNDDVVRVLMPFDCSLSADAPCLHEGRRYV